MVRSHYSLSMSFFMILGSLNATENNNKIFVQPSPTDTLWEYRRGDSEGPTVFQENFELERGATIAIEIIGNGPIETFVSDFQTIEVFQTKPFGKMLVHDGIIMLTEFDNFAYHEMIAHVPLMAHPNPKRVLIVGGGDGGTLTEVLKHDSVQEVVLCEIDGAVIDVCKRHFPEFSASFDDSRVTIELQDAAEYIKTKKDYFDIVCVDSTDPIGPGIVLFEMPFYKNIQETLTEDGIAATQGESMYYHGDMIKTWNTRNQTLFSVATYYYTVIPTYPSGTIGFLYCSKKYNPVENLTADRVAKLSDLQYYNEAIHRASFVLPTFMGTVN